MYAATENPRRKTGAYTLVEVLVGGAIFAFLALAASQIFEHRIRATKKLHFSYSREELKRGLLEEMSCILTLYQCQDLLGNDQLGPLLLKAKSGKLMATQRGRWMVQGQCSKDPASNEYYLQVLAGRFDRPDQPTIDPMTGKPMSLRPLFEQGAEPCRIVTIGRRACPPPGSPALTLLQGIDNRGNAVCVPPSNALAEQHRWDCGTSFMNGTSGPSPICQPPPPAFANCPACPCPDVFYDWGGCPAGNSNLKGASCPLTKSCMYSTPKPFLDPPYPGFWLDANACAAPPP